MAALTGNNLLDSVMESTGIELNELIYAILSAKLQQMIDNGTYSNLAATIAISGFSTEINAAVEINELNDAVATNSGMIEAATEEGVDAGLDFPSVWSEPPVAEDDVDLFTVLPGGSVDISAATLMDNDSDADGDDLTITELSGTTGGTAVLSEDGLTITFTADADFEGTASFVYTLSDGTDTATATVTGEVTDDITELPFTNGSNEDAAEGAFQYNVEMGDTEIFAGNIANFGDDDFINIGDDYLDTENLLFNTTGTTEINFAFGDLTDYTPSFTINLTGLDAELVSAVEAASADSVAVMGILNAEWGDGWLM